LPGPVGGNIIIRTSLFESNIAGEAGGAAFLFGYPPDQMLLENSTFINNKAIGSAGSAGGGVRQGNSDLTVINSYFGNNTAELTVAVCGWEKGDMSTLPTVHFPATGLVVLVEDCLSIKEIPFRLTSLIPLLLIISLMDMRRYWSF
jgi:hypothetical protein